ncbi:acyl-CoA--sterol O-acyltransferase 1-like [Melia azedarach]|uniref:Acyl-CoA--sterol O-acyltransferase 1-like n=1 Tax=Melia azedarach TaxID=155640 RepID=A0ACC1XLH2_MELAZ|nr:acyl-CoA--sterol O-acyltransferase 1-like [Melia azedarach]
MDGEIKNFIMVWVSVAVCLCYCYVIGKTVSKGVKRLIFVIPIVCLFLYLPLFLYSAHLGGTTAFFIPWLTNFKLLLFAFGLGPLSSDPSISLPLFVLVSALPIKIQRQNPSPKSHQNGHTQETPSPNSHQNGFLTPSPSSPHEPDPKPKEGLVNYAIKGFLLAIMVRAYDYSDFIHPKLILLLYAFHIYFLLELILAVSAALARAILGLELEPQFNEPYLATSLQDFWGRRWNIMVATILRPTVYKPSLKICARFIGRKWAPLPAVFATFMVSGFMHELMFYYLGRMEPTWEVTRFFVLHGICLVVEIAAKKAVDGKFRLPRLISGPLTVAFVMGTGLTMFFPHFSRCKVDTKAFEEYRAVGNFLSSSVGQNVLLRVWN